VIDFAIGQDFLVAVQRRYQIDEPIEWNNLKGVVVEAISHQDYLEVWAFRGFPSEGISAIRPRFYYRCVRIPSDVGLETGNDSERTLRE
jgi:hypothetical protein